MEYFPIFFFFKKLVYVQPKTNENVSLDYNLTLSIMIKILNCALMSCCHIRTSCSLFAHSLDHFSFIHLVCLIFKMIFSNCSSEKEKKTFATCSNYISVKKSQIRKKGKDGFAVLGILQRVYTICTWDVHYMLRTGWMVPGNWTFEKRKWNIQDTMIKLTLWVNLKKCDSTRFTSRFMQ